MTVRRGHRAGEVAVRRRLRLPSATSLLSLPVLVAFGLFTSPARAMPAASMQLFRVDGQGVKPLPAVSAVLAAANGARPSGTGSPAAGPLLAQANGAEGGLSVLRQSFVGRLPANLSGNIRLVSVNPDGTLGGIVEEIPFDSANVSFSADRTQLFVRPNSPIAPGQSVMLQLPSRSPTGFRYVYPNHLTSTPCVFQGTAVSSLPAAGAAAAAPAAAPAAAAAASSFPVWAVVLGVVVVGVGVAAASGAFSNGGGGGGTNPSSQ